MTYQDLEFEGKARTHRGSILSAPMIPLHWLVAGIVASGFGVAVMMVRNRLAIDATNWAFDALVLLMGLLVFVRYSTRQAQSRWQARWRDFSESAILMLTISLLGAIGSYEMAAVTSGFYDATLEHADQLLHFDWLSWYMMVVRHPILQEIGTAAYLSVYFTPLVLLAWLAWHGKRAHSRQFLMTFWLASVLTIVLFPILPARGALEFMWHGPIVYMPTNGLYQGEIIPALRTHAITQIELGSVRGIVCAPSFHTVCAVIYIISAWPFAALRRFLVPLNVTMLLATPVEGTHYLSDIILGAIVAAIAIMIVRAAAIFTPQWKEWTQYAHRHPGSL